MLSVNFALCLRREICAIVVSMLQQQFCQPGDCFMQTHILDLELGDSMVHDEIKDSTGRTIKFEDLDGTVLQFATAACPAKRAFAFHAEMALHYGSDKKWPAATKLHIPSFAWSSETCDSEIRERFFRDLMQLSSLATASSDAESDVDLEALALSS